MKFTNREKKAEKISKKEKNNIRILNRMFLAVVLIIVVLLIILGVLVLRKKTGLSLEVPYEEHMTVLSEQEEGLQLAESFAQGLCVSGAVSYTHLKGGAFSRLFLRSCHRSVLRRYSGAQCPYLYVSGLSERVCSQNLL